MSLEYSIQYTRSVFYDQWPQTNKIYDMITLVDMRKILHKSSSKYAARLSRWWGEQPVVFEKAFDRKHNAIGFMRTAFALLVIVGHSFHLGGFGLDTLARFSNGQQAFGTLAVLGFFILSGYLITASFVYASSVWRYLWNRFLRIMPAFWAALIVVAFGFAPLMYFLQNGTLGGFLVTNDGGPLQYILKNAGLNIQQYDVSGLTGNIPWPNAFNGSLWTLIYEVTGYILIAAFGIFGVFKKHSKVVLGATLTMFGLYIMDRAAPGSAGNIIPFFKDIQLLPLMLFFFAGATWYLYQDKIPLSNRYFILASVLYILSLRYDFYTLVGPLTFVYIIFYLAAKLPLKSFDRKADFSYGIYIYAFPAQQLLSQLGAQSMGVWVYSLLAALITLPLAVASFYLIERPALKLKSAQLRVRKWRKA